jgi:hypothetical protein
MSGYRGIFRLGPVVFCIHRDGLWMRSGHGDGPGYVVLGPRHRPLFSERHGRGGKVIVRWRGWRIRRMEPLARASGESGSETE